jgi:hypothetical protein
VASFARFWSRLRRPSPAPSASKLIAPGSVRAMLGFVCHERHVRHARLCHRDDFGPCRRVSHGATPTPPLRIHTPSTDG